MPALNDKTIVLGVSGGIAAYKSAELVRLLVNAGANVRVMMTRNATEFITPLTLQTLSSNPVATDTFSLTQESEIGHIRLADSADAIVIAPATADVIAKAAVGIADDIVTTVLLATRAKVAFAPSMNVHMYEHPTVAENLAKLRSRGAVIIEPGEGALACGYEGKGRLPDPAIVVAEIEKMLSAQDLAGENILVTAGPTQEPIDPVRFVTEQLVGQDGLCDCARGMASRCGGANRRGSVRARDALWRRANRHGDGGRDARANVEQFSVVNGARDGGGGCGFPSRESGQSARSRKTRAGFDSRWNRLRTRCHGSRRRRARAS